MNQTRTFLMFALFAVAYFLFMAWEKDYAPPAPVAAVASSSAQADGSVPTATPDASTATPTPGAVPGAIPPTTSSQATSQLITISTDVLNLTLDTRGGSVVHADLLDYPSLPKTSKQPNPPPTTLLDTNEVSYFVAQNGLVSSSDAESSGDFPERENRLHDG